MAIMLVLIMFAGGALAAFAHSGYPDDGNPDDFSAYINEHMHDIGKDDPAAEEFAQVYATVTSAPIAAKPLALGQVSTFAELQEAVNGAASGVERRIEVIADFPFEAAIHIQHGKIITLYTSGGIRSLNAPVNEMHFIVQGTLNLQGGVSLAGNGGNGGGINLQNGTITLTDNAAISGGIVRCDIDSATDGDGATDVSSATDNAGATAGSGAQIGHNPAPATPADQETETAPPDVPSPTSDHAPSPTPSPTPDQAPSPTPIPVTPQSQGQPPAQDQTPSGPPAELAGSASPADPSAQSQTALGNVQIVARAQQSGNPLQGAVFAVYHVSDDTRLAELATGENGQVAHQLAPGEYYLRQQTAAFGYLPEAVRIFFIVESGKTVLAEVTNQRDTDVPYAQGGDITLPQTGELTPVKNYVLGVFLLALAMLCGIGMMCLRKPERSNRKNRRGVKANA